jgi:hypothetical protein
MKAADFISTLTVTVREKEVMASRLMMQLYFTVRLNLPITELQGTYIFSVAGNLIGLVLDPRDPLKILR